MSDRKNKPKAKSKESLLSQAEMALRESEARYRELFESVPVGLYRSTHDGKFLDANTIIAYIFGYPDRESFLALSAKDVYVDLTERERWQSQLESEGTVRNFEFRSRKADGTSIWVRDTARIVQDGYGQILYYEGSLEDVTERKQAEMALRESESRYRDLFEGVPVGLYRTTPNGNFLDANAALVDMFGYDDLESLLAAPMIASYVDPEDRTRWQDLIEKEEVVHNFEMRFRRVDGTIIRVRDSARIIRDENGQVMYYNGSLEDITSRKEAEERLAHDALHDGLTGLPNRTLFLDRLEHVIKKTNRSGDYAFAVLFLDIDRFKLVNDSLGHAIGDLLLIAISERLQNSLRPGDSVARLGGDEFAILLEDVNDAAHATRIANRIQVELMQPNILEEHQITTSASIGITLSKDEYKDAEELLRDADTAMYRAKALGKARHEIFNPGMHAEVTSVLQLEADLRQAIKDQEFRVFYQPLVSLESGQIVGTEALLRWQHPQRGILPPGTFITVLEETGMIVPVGEWVLRTACTQNKAWQDAGHLGLRIAVNFSVRQIQLKNLPDLVRDVLDETGMPPETLELEITESVAIKDAEQTIKILNALHEIGAGISLDDFGSGYSSLGYLNQYPFEKLKADRSFVMDIINDPSDAAITAAIIAMAHSLKIRVVAEGVETKEQLDMLRSQDCDEVQGYYFSRPVPAQQLDKLLENMQIIPKSENK